MKMENREEEKDVNSYIIKHFEAYRKSSDYFLYNTKYFIETMAKEHDYKVQDKLLRELILKYSIVERELAQKVKEITLMSVTDQLTQIFNRHRIIEEMEKAMNSYKRHNQIFTVALFDIDHFKKVNDSYGHDAGDAVLKNLAQNVKINLRTTDVLGRWGGEEFIIIFFETGLESAAIASEKIRKFVENIEREDVVKITCSFGITQGIEEDSIESIIKRADEQLYKAKAMGRNRVCY